LVDNASTDNSKETFLSFFPKGTFILLDQNYGFAHPNNVGYLRSQGKYLVTLNNDMILDRNFLANAVNFIEKTSGNIFAIGCKMVNYYNRNIIDTIGIEPLINGGGINIGKAEPIDQYNNHKEIFGPCAGAAFYKRDIIDKIGFFDEFYFAYLEDLDLAHRAHRRGYRSMYCPDSICYHKHSVTSSKRPFFKLFLIERNKLINLWKHYPFYYLIIEPFFSLLFPFRYLLSSTKRNKISSKQRNYMHIFYLPKILAVYLKARLSFILYVLTNTKKLI